MNCSQRCKNAVVVVFARNEWNKSVGLNARETKMAVVNAKSETQSETK